MSWDAYFYSDQSRTHEVLEQNYTHNTNQMINIPLREAGLLGEHSWWEELNRKSGSEGANLLRVAISGMMLDAPRLRALNPENGWGTYDTLLPVLLDMWMASSEYPDGVWDVSG